MPVVLGSPGSIVLGVGSSERLDPLPALTEASVAAALLQELAELADREGPAP
jgi:hypothetical protein